MNPILLDLPDQFETERLLARVPRPGEGPVTNAAIRESMDTLRPWMMWAQRDPTDEESEARSRQAQAHFLAREYFRFNLWRKSDSAFVGGLSLNPVDWQIPLFEMGYWARTSLQGHGYVTEAVQGLAQYAFTHLGAKRLEIFCDPRNPRSAAVAERCGFSLEARLARSWRSMQGELVDSLMYVRLAPGERDVRPHESNPLPDQRLLLDVPEELESERLLLRVPRAGDGPMVHAAILESEDHLRPWMHWIRDGQTAEATEIFRRESAVRFVRRESFTYLLQRRTDARFVGICSLFNLDWDVPSGEIGYWLHAAMQGHGYMTEAVNRLTAFVFDDLGMRRVEIRCDARNAPSAAVAERAGYTLEARLRQHRRAPDGTLADTLVYARLRGEV